MMRTRPTPAAILFVLFLHVASQVGAQTTTQTASSSFWAFQPVVDIPPPAVNDREWPHTDLDRFVLAKLEERELRPSPRADKRTLLRRVTFDLVGVPPTPAEVASFLQRVTESVGAGTGLTWPAMLTRTVSTRTLPTQMRGAIATT